jgi:hypothetical protein
VLNRLFPRQIDNFYQGHVLAIWLFIPVLALKTAMGFNVGGLNPFISSRFVLATADGVPVDTYSADAAAHLVFTFAAWGWALFLLALLGWIVILRYRAMLPLMILVLSFEQIGRMVLARTMPPHHALAHHGIAVGTLINWGFAALLVLALLLSLLKARPRPA